MKEEIEIFIANSANNIALIQDNHGIQSRHNNVRETVINQHTINCIIRVGMKISALHHDNVESKVMLKNVNRHVKSSHSICRLKLEIVRNGTATSNDLKPTTEKLEQEIEMSEICDNKVFENNSIPIDHLLGIKAKNFTTETSVNDHMIERKKINLDEMFNREPNIWN